MKIGPGELLLVVLIIVIMVAVSRARKSSQEAKERAEAEQAAARRSVAPDKAPIKYPQLQLLGVLVMIAGAALAILAYLDQQQVLGTWSIAGIGVAILGIGFIILARRR